MLQCYMAVKTFSPSSHKYQASQFTFRAQNHFKDSSRNPDWSRVITCPGYWPLIGCEGPLTPALSDSDSEMSWYGSQGHRGREAVLNFNNRGNSDDMDVACCWKLFNTPPILSLKIIKYSSNIQPVVPDTGLNVPINVTLSPCCHLTSQLVGDNCAGCDHNIGDHGGQSWPCETRPSCYHVSSESWTLESGRGGRASSEITLPP